MTARVRELRRGANRPEGGAVSRASPRPDALASMAMGKSARSRRIRRAPAALGASTIPFLYIVYELFVGLGDAVKKQPEGARNLVNVARWLTFMSWGFYPIVYMIPYTSLSGSTVETGVQIGYTIADLIAKAGVGVLIYLIARRKSISEGFKAV